MIKFCAKHGYTEFGKNGCNECNYNRVYDRRRKIKHELVEYKGGKCEKCGYDKCEEALDFHHLDPNKKDFTISSYANLSIKKLKEETDKCVLVCANCHREIHKELNEAKRKEMLMKEKSYIEDYYKNKSLISDKSRVVDSYQFLPEESILQDIDNGLTKTDMCKKYSINLRTLNQFFNLKGIEYRSKKNLCPNKDVLVDLLKNNSISSISRMYGVSFNAVKKWCKKYDL